MATVIGLPVPRSTRFWTSSVTTAARLVLVSSAMNANRFWIASLARVAALRLGVSTRQKSVKSPPLIVPSIRGILAGGHLCLVSESGGALRRDLPTFDDLAGLPRGFAILVSWLHAALT